MKFTMMQKNNPVLRLEMDSENGRIRNICDIICPERVPLGVFEPPEAPSLYRFEQWWHSRAVPMNRQGIQQSLRILGCSIEKLVLDNLGLSLSDQYWIKPDAQADLLWEQVNFFDNPFSEVLGAVLWSGRADAGCESRMRSPDPSLNGWLKKRWSMRGNTRILIKGGDGFRQQPFNEVIASILCDRLGISHVPYQLEYLERNLPVCVCPDFVTRDTELIPAQALLQCVQRYPNEPNYDFVCRCFAHYRIPAFRERFDEMIVLDYLLANQDRHFGNFGVIRNVETLAFEGLAPIFDSGNSLRYDTPAEWIDPALDVEAMPFAPKHSEQIRLVSGIRRFDLSGLDTIEAEVRNVFSDERAAPYLGRARQALIIQVLCKRIEMLHSCIAQDVTA